MIVCRRANESSFCRFEEWRWLKVGEAVSVAALSALVFISLIYAVPDCQPIRSHNTSVAHDPSRLHDVNASATATSTSSMAVRNSTVYDVIGTHDVTPTTPGMPSVSERDDEDLQAHEPDSYGYDSDHGYVFQV